MWSGKYKRFKPPGEPHCNPPLGALGLDLGGEPDHSCAGLTGPLEGDWLLTPQTQEPIQPVLASVDVCAQATAPMSLWIGGIFRNLAEI